MAAPLRNADIATVLREIALFLAMEGEPFKPRAYEKAAQSIEAAAEPCSELFASGGVKQLATIPGIGKSIAAKIGELLATGRMAYREELCIHRVILVGPEDPARYLELADAVDRHCPVLDFAANPVPVERVIETRRR